MTIKATLLYLPEYFKAEYELACYIRDLATAGCDKIPVVADGLYERQGQAVEHSCTKSFSVLTGAAGTGKTTTLKQVITSYRKAGLNGVIVSPYGKAAKRADEVVNGNIPPTEKVDCSTIHRLLHFDRTSGGFVHNRHNRLQLDYVVIDEGPTCGVSLLRDLLSALEPTRTRVVFSGDQHQLPSIEPGNVGRDLVGTPLPQMELDIVKRSTNGIVLNANRLLQGLPFLKCDPETGKEFTDFFWTPSRNEDETFGKIVRWATETIPEKRKYNPLTDIQVLSPGKKSTVGTHSLNEALRRKLIRTKQAAYGFNVGDKVINKVNNYTLGIMNGEVGVVQSIVNQGRQPTIMVDFGLGPIEISYEWCQNLELAFAYTAHKSQGSEYKSVIAPLHNCHTILLYRNMLYTLVTRSRELCNLVGDEIALGRAIRNDSPSKRITRLRSILNKMLNN